MKRFWSFSHFCLISTIITFALLIHPLAANADFADSFTAPNGTELHAYNPSVYTYQNSSQPLLYIQNNTLPGLYTYSTVIVNNNNFINGCMSGVWTGNYINMTIRSAGFQPGETTPQVFYQIYSSPYIGNNFELNGFYDGIFHTLASGSIDMSGTHYYKICAIGSTISAYQDNTLLGSATDTGITTSGYETFNLADPHGDSILDSLAITVSNTPPSVGTVIISPNPAQINSSVAAITTFTDSDTGQTHTATANWGDGTNTSTSCSVTEPNGSTPGSVNCPFSSGYAAANVYPITITVSDGISQTTSAVTYESVFDPTQSSIFSAGEKYDNPPTANPSTSGSVKFGLTYKYKGGTANGNRAFTMDFNEANIHFTASYVTSLVISNGMATLMGTGTIDGQTGTYNFLVTGINNGGIRIQITDSSNNVIYDTQPGDPITATPTTTSANMHVLVQ